MSLHQQITINSGYTRSINLQRDQKNTLLLDTYLPTTKSLQALQQFAKGFAADNLERSIAFIGPYGSGKSAFALFLSALLSPRDSEQHQTAIRVLQRHHVEEALIKQYQNKAKGEAYLRLMINGVPGSLIQQLIDCLALEVECHNFPVGLFKQIKAAQKKKPSIQETLSLLENVQTAWAELGGTGVLLEIDEMGKFLEFEAIHPQQQEIHLLQLLAEHSQQHSDTPFQLIVMLHQSFDQYTVQAGKKLRDEWQKIQGRFNAFAFVESAEQVIRVIETAFTQQIDLTTTIKMALQNWSQSLLEVQALPHGLDTDHAQRLFQNCYPLHPLTLLILPVLCQKVAQNERTLFTYLGSEESHSFLSSLASLEMGDWIYPSDLYDYFLLNQAHGFSDPLTYKRWLEVVTALNRLEAEIDAGETRLLKTIGLLNLIGSQRGLKASNEVLHVLFGDSLSNLLDNLQKQSLITYRQFNKEYRVWQGSDFDINAVMQSMRVELEGLPLADTINEIKPLNDLLVRGVTIETGITRSFAPLFIDKYTDRSIFSKEDYPISMLFYLSNDENDKLEDTQIGDMGCYNIVAECPPDFTTRIRESVLEHLILQELPNRHTEVHDDTVVKYEYQQWLSIAEQRSHAMFRSLIESPEHLTWHFDQIRTIKHRHDLQRELTQWIKNECYPDAPTLRNELINCEKPSPSAVTGRKRLIEAMLSMAHQDKLGIQKTPAELSIYLSVLSRSGIHRKEQGHWGFFPPPLEDVAELSPLWNKVHELLGNSGGKQIPVQDIYNILQQPPFGVPAGILPVLLVSYLLAHQRSVALYQEGIFCDELTPDLVAMLVKRPVYFSLERFDLSGLRGELFDQYFRKVIGKTIHEDASLLEIIKPLIRFINQLPPYSLQSSDVSKITQNVRSAFAQAQSPGVLLFRSLPEACGIDPTVFEAGKSGVVESFIKALVKALRELNQAFPRLVSHWQQLLNNELLDEPASDVAALRLSLRRRYQGLDRLTPDQKVLGAFIRRITEASDKSDEAWLMSVGTLLSGVPAEKWRDQHRVQAELLLQERSQQVRDLERLKLSESVSGDAGDAMLIRWMGRTGEQSRVVQLSTSQRERVGQEVKKIECHLDQLDETQRLAILGVLLERLSD